MNQIKKKIIVKRKKKKIVAKLQHLNCDKTQTLKLLQKLTNLKVTKQKKKKKYIGSATGYFNNLIR